MKKKKNKIEAQVESETPKSHNIEKVWIRQVLNLSNLKSPKAANPNLGTAAAEHFQRGREDPPGKHKNK